ncbi:phosphatase PAP2 family protein [Lysinibacillus sp. 54212]|uniref:phosphatase PAP2 family protein n=1 Tax=Lysinibacillus sp. 54212 TaxID=3119829 RepID=UPI002FC8E7B9
MKILSYGLAIVTLIVFFILKVNYEQPSFVAFDESMSELLGGNELIILFHNIGDTGFVVTVALVLLVWLWVRERNFRGMLFVLMTIAFGNVLNQVLKIWIERPRPELVDQLTSFSFPSGHSMTGVLYLLTVAYLLSQLVASNRRVVLLWIVAIILACLIGMARVAEGRHYATDVLAGWSMGYTWFIVCVIWYEKRKRVFEKIN